MSGKFFLAIKDHDREMFSVHELADDTAYTDAVSKAQDAGRNITCETLTGASDAADAISRVTATHPSYKQVASALTK